MLLEVLFWRYVTICNCEETCGKAWESTVIWRRVSRAEAEAKKGFRCSAAYITISGTNKRGAYYLRSNKQSANLPQQTWSLKIPASQAPGISGLQVWSSLFFFASLRHSAVSQHFCYFLVVPFSLICLINSLMMYLHHFWLTLYLVDPKVKQLQKVKWNTWAIVEGVSSWLMLRTVNSAKYVNKEEWVRQHSVFPSFHFSCMFCNVFSPQVWNAWIYLVIFRPA